MLTSALFRSARGCKTAAALLACVALFPAPGARAQNYAAPPMVAGSAPVPAAGTPAPGQSHRWPMVINTDGGQITIYQPQATSLTGDKLSGRAAVSILRPGQTDPIFGAIWMESRIATDRVARTVQVQDIEVTKAHFPDANGATEQELTAALRSVLAQEPMTLSLDHLLATLQVGQQEKQATQDLATAPPAIIFRDHPAVLVQYDGQPRLVQAAGSAVMQVINTPFFVALDPPTKLYYLEGGGRWYSATSPAGPFQSAGQVPQEVVAAAQAGGYQDPQQPLTDAQAASVEIVTATDPTELVWTDGPEEMGTIAGTDLLYVINTNADVFMLIDTQQLFVLLSGRWYTSPNRNGPWAYVAPDQLPADFQRIPPDSAKGSVLASVANTSQAKDAIADTFVPQTAAIDLQNYQQPSVTYDGAPQFQPVTGTAVTYAVNTPNSVLCVAGQYYCCSDGVWYVAAQPGGPWAICTSVPPAIYTIPPTCPDYPVTFCYVYGVTPTFAYVGYLPGYLGCYRYHGVVLFGTGYHYQPWWGGNFHTYYPRAYTFGFGARYDPYTGHWGFGIGVRVGVEGSFTGWFSHRAGPVAHVGGWFGHGGFRPVVRFDQQHHPDLAAHRAEMDVYARRKDVRQDITPFRGAARPGAGPGAHVEVKWTPRPAAPNVGVGGNNVFAGPNGNIYRKTLDGWEQRSSNKWVPAAVSPRAPAVGPGGGHGVAAVPERHEGSPPAEHHEAGTAPRTVPSELNNEYRARVAGEDRSREFGGVPAAPAQSRGGGESRSAPAPAPAPRGGGGGGGGGNSGGGNSGNGGGGGRNR